MPVVTAGSALLLVVVAVIGLVLAHAPVAELGTRYTPASEVNGAVREAMGDAALTVGGYDRDPTTAGRIAYAEQKQQILDQLDRLDALLAEDPSLSGDVGQERTAISTWFDRAQLVLDRPGSGSAADTEARTQAFTDVRAASSALRDALDGRTRELVASAVRRAAVAAGLVVLTAAAGVVAVLGPRQRTLRRIGKPWPRPHDSAEVLTEVSEQQRAQLATELRLAEAVRRLAGCVSRPLDVGGVVDAAILPLAETFRTSAAWIRAFDGSGERPGRGRGARWPERDETIASSELTALARRLAYDVWRRQTQVVVSASGVDPPRLVTQAERDALLGFTRQLRAETVVLVPVGVGHDCLGYLVMIRPDDGPDWSTEELAAARQIGRELGRAVLHARLFQREQDLVAELQALEEKKSDFVSMISHELRTPLSSIIGHLELLRGGDIGSIDADAQLSLRAVDRNAVRLRTLIEDLLLISRIEEQVQPTKLRSLDLSEVVETVVDVERERAERKSIMVRVEAGRPAPVLGDRHELERVIGNLVGNAVKFSAPGTTVSVAVLAEPDTVRLTVSDDGLGLSTADQQRLFTRFFRSDDPEARALPGVGLGLTISKLLVERHRGTIAVASALRAGSSFTVTLPRANPDGNAERDRGSLTRRGSSLLR